MAENSKQFSARALSCKSCISIFKEWKGSRYTIYIYTPCTSDRPFMARRRWERRLYKKQSYDKRYRRCKDCSRAAKTYVFWSESRGAIEAIYVLPWTPEMKTQGSCNNVYSTVSRHSGRGDKHQHGRIFGNGFGISFEDGSWKCWFANTFTTTETLPHLSLEPNDKRQ